MGSLQNKNNQICSHKKPLSFRFTEFVELSGQRMMCSERECGLNFLQDIFFSSISLLSNLAGYDLVQHYLILPNSNRISYFCEVCLQEPEGTALFIRPFLYNHSVSDISVGLNNTKQRDFVKVKAKTSIFIENLTKVPIKLQKAENCRFL